MELPPQLRQLRDFYFKTARALPPDRDFVHAPGLIDKPTFFTLANVKSHLNNPALTTDYFALFWQGKHVDASGAVVGKPIKPGVELKFFDRGILEEYLGRGASLVLEGLDLLEPAINAMCAAIDAAGPGCVFSNAVAFYSQRGNEAYPGHLDQQDVLVIHLAGEKRWRIYERQPLRYVDTEVLSPERMGRQQAEIAMRPGDALFLKAATPHQVETTAGYSLHISFDICDRNVAADMALTAMLQEYMKETAPCYAQAPQMLEKLLAGAATDAFRQRVAEMQAKRERGFQYMRGLLGANRVKALDRWIVADSGK